MITIDRRQPCYPARHLALLLGVFLLGANAADAQVSLGTLGSPVSENFDTLATTGTANPWSDNSVIIGWYAAQTAGTLTAYRAGDGSSNAGALYSFGTGTAAERALGSVGSGTPQNLIYAVRLVNNTPATLTSLDVSYTGEQWRNGGNTTAQKLDFQYQVANAGVITGANVPSTGWTNEDTLDFTGPIATATAAALDGNQAANRVAIVGSISVTVNPGQEVWIRWFDTNDSGNDHGLAIDDFSVTPQGVLPPDLSIDDVSVTEGNSGTVVAGFTVSLSAPAPAGGVTFDIATSDGSATVADNDYVASSLVAQTIPAGSSTFAFDVTVNGDIAFEADETFLVTVSNVSGANPLDPQGQGTILNDDTSSDLSVTVAVAPNPVIPGDTVSYTLNVNNAGPDAASNVNVSLILPIGFASATAPAGWSCSTPAIGATGPVTCNTASLPASGAATFTVQATVPFGTAPGDLSATASVSADNSDPSPANNASTAIVTVIAGPSLPAVAIPLVHGRLALALAGLFLGLGLFALVRRGS